jgi:hypothetical protein
MTNFARGSKSISTLEIFEVQRLTQTRPPAHFSRLWTSVYQILYYGNTIRSVDADLQVRSSSA